MDAGLSGDSNWDTFMTDNSDIEKAIRSMSRSVGDYKSVYDDFNAREEEENSPPSTEPNYEQVKRTVWT